MNGKILKLVSTDESHKDHSEIEINYNKLGIINDNNSVRVLRLNV